MQGFIHRPIAACAGALCCLLLAGPATASPPGWEAVDAAALDRLRGGFTTHNGLEVSLGIERLVSINGQVVSRTSFQIADVRRLDPGQARAAGAALSAVQLIQNGSDNTAGALFSADTLGGTVIQNTLNNQQIESRTVIHSSVNSLGLLKTINFNGNLSDAIARAAGPG